MKSDKEEQRQEDRVTWRAFVEQMPPPLRAMLLLGILGTASTATAYAVWFGAILGDPLSQSTSDWAAFGTYVGGVLNPILTFLMFLSVLFTIVVQQQEAQESRRAQRETLQELEEASTAAHRQAGLLVLQQNWMTFESHMRSLELMLQGDREALRSSYSLLVREVSGLRFPSSEESELAAQFGRLLSSSAVEQVIGTPAVDRLSRKLVLVLTGIRRAQSDLNVDPTGCLDIICSVTDPNELQLFAVFLAGRSGARFRKRLWPLVGPEGLFRDLRASLADGQAAQPLDPLSRLVWYITGVSQIPLP